MAAKAGRVEEEVLGEDGLQVVDGGAAVGAALGR